MNLIDNYFCIGLSNISYIENMKSENSSSVYGIDIVTRDWILVGDPQSTFSTMFSSYVCLKWIIAADKVFGVLV